MSPVSSTLYRTARWVVILAGLSLIPFQILPGQLARREAAPRGPRALGLVELAANGKAHLIPVVIMDEGRFYDASAYKASPVPMALEWGTVYEAVRTGVSQGLFTVSAAFRGKNTWIGDGKWQSASEIAAAAAKKPAVASKPPEDKDTPPLLRRSTSDKPKSPEPPSPQATPQSTSTATPPPASAPSSPASSAPAPTPSTPTASDPFENDPNRPMLRRGKPAPRPADQDFGTSPAKTPPPALTGSVQLIPAISDAAGPEPRPYAYSLKPEEEEKFRTRMLALAGEEVRVRSRQLAAEIVGAPTSATNSSRSGKAAAAKGPQPTFDNMQLRVFDLSNSNEPVLVLTTQARMPEAAKAAKSDLQYYVTVVARNDLYGELHKAFSNVTDSQHLDVSPRFDLIDAVDVDGDGRGELLFRQNSDAGTAFVVYRVIGDRLWPLFQGTPGQGIIN
jgi:hypothetical protein